MALFLLGVIVSIALGLFLAPYAVTMVALAFGFLIVFGGYWLTIFWLDNREGDPSE